MSLTTILFDMTETSTSRPAGGGVEVCGEVAYIAIPPFGGPRAQIRAPTVIAVYRSGPVIPSHRASTTTRLAGQDWGTDVRVLSWL